MEYIDFGFGVIEEENNTMCSTFDSQAVSDVEVESKHPDRKTCIHCLETFPATLEYFRKESKPRKTKFHDGLSSVCKCCAKKRDRGYREKTKGEMNENLNLVYEDYKGNDDERKLATILHKNARSRALKHNREFTLSIEDLLPLPAFCQYTGVPLMYNRENHDHSASLDRIDNDKGYTKENIRIVTQKVNKTKSGTSVDEMLEKVKLFTTVLKELGKTI